MSDTTTQLESLPMVSPSDANWYWSVVFENQNGETDYNDGYSSNRVTRRQLRSFFSSEYGVKVLETNVQATPRNPDYRPICHR